MEQKSERLYPSALIEKNINHEQGLEQKINDVNSFNNYNNNIKEMITYFEDKNKKSKKKYVKNKTITTILKSFDTFVIITTTSSSLTLSLTEIGLIAIPMSTATTCGLSVTNKVLYQILMQKYNIYKKLYEKDQQTVKSFEKFYRKSLQGNLIDKNEYESLCIIFY